MKLNGSSGVQLRTPRDLASLVSYTALKFYLQSPEPAPGQVAGDQFVLYMGSRQVAGGLGGLGGAGRQVGAGGPQRVPVPLSLVPLQATGDYMGVALRGQKVHWVYRLGEAGPTALSIDEDIGEQFAAVSIDRWEARPPRCSPPPPGVAACPHLPLLPLPSGPSSLAICLSQWRIRWSKRPRVIRRPLGPKGCSVCSLMTLSSTWEATLATSR